MFFDIEWMQMVVKGKTPKGKRRAFTDQERNKILTNTKSDKGWKYYLPRIALLTGCRLNEIAQLRISDIVLGESPYLSINADGDDKRLKNEASHRDIPLSKALYKLLSPLLKAKTGNELLFNDLPYGVDNGYNSKPSKYFSKMCKSLVFKDVSFHSFRHYVITKLFNAGVKEELIGSLIGHSVGKLTTGKVYLSGFTYGRTSVEMSCLAPSKYHVELSSEHLFRCFGLT